MELEERGELRLFWVGGVPQVRGEKHVNGRFCQESWAGVC